MKLIKLLPVMAIASVCVAGQVHAAQDPLMMPEQPAAPLTAEQQDISLAVPSEEVKAVVSEFAAFQLGMSNALIQDDNRVMSGQQRYTNNVLYYMNVRRSWYITSHRYKKDSYVLLSIQNDDRYSKTEALLKGIDDYIYNDFRLEELSAKIKAIVRVLTKILSPLSAILTEFLGSVWALTKTDAAIESVKIAFLII